MTTTTPRGFLALQYVAVLALTLDVVGQLVGVVGSGSRDFLLVTVAAALALLGARLLTRRASPRPAAAARG